MNNPAKYREWIHNAPALSKEDESIVFAAIDAWERYQQNKKGLKECLETIVFAASSSHKTVFDIGCRILADLAKSDIEAQHCFYELSASKSAVSRFHAVAYLEDSLPVKLLHDIIERALKDKSIVVKIKGIEQSISFFLFQYSIEEGMPL